jgi:hypothetical protein
MCLKAWSEREGFEPSVPVLASTTVSKWIDLAALTRFQVLTVGCVASESDSVPLIRQLFCSAEWFWLEAIHSDRATITISIQFWTATRMLIECSSD